MRAEGNNADEPYALLEHELRIPETEIINEGAGDQKPAWVEESIPWLSDGAAMIGWDVHQSTVTRVSRMKRIKEIFDSEYQHWAITFPEEDLEERLEGEIMKAGWMILYRFGRDDEGEYLWVFAAHRMTNDRHYRIHESGKVTSLPAIIDFVVTRNGAVSSPNYVADPL